MLAFAVAEIDAMPDEFVGAGEFERISVAFADARETTDTPTELRLQCGEVFGIRRGKHARRFGWRQRPHHAEIAVRQRQHRERSLRREAFVRRAVGGARRTDVRDHSDLLVILDFGREPSGRTHL